VPDAADNQRGQARRLLVRHAPGSCTRKATRHRAGQTASATSGNTWAARAWCQYRSSSQPMPAQKHDEGVAHKVQQPGTRGKLAPGQGEGPARGGQRHETAPRIEGVDGADDGSLNGVCPGGRAHGTPTAVDVLDGMPRPVKKGRARWGTTRLAIGRGPGARRGAQRLTQQRRHAPR